MFPSKIRTNNTKLLETMLKLVVVVLHLCSCGCVELQYKSIIKGKGDGDQLGYSLATGNHNIAIGAPYANNHTGTVMVGPGVYLKGPRGRKNFGGEVAVNGNYLVVGGHNPPSVYVYSALDHQAKSSSF